MSDETKMNDELQQFADQLQRSDLPSAKVDRDQLMYDAGWAAAKESVEAVSIQTTQTKRNGFSSLALSFCGGVAVAAALLLSILPLGDGDPGNAKSSIAANTPSVEPNVADAANSTVAASDEFENKIDLLEWIEKLPAGHTVDSGFSSRPNSLVLMKTDLTTPRAVNPLSRMPKTSQQIMQELMPTSVRTRKTNPSWASWLGARM